MLLKLELGYAEEEDGVGEVFTLGSKLPHKEHEKPSTAAAAAAEKEEEDDSDEPSPRRRKLSEGDDQKKSKQAEEAKETISKPVKEEHGNP
ncbi:hypothetical protein K443DRAFT_8853 [Laccaria amethystina LaAM-08-1]|uniref:Uncharacterized protein n=1 Tax=Laccaria amethystina LaAM-08-1 TaxID=1095629 RepID=A0A0C9XSL8_9AGAR|nr:hypothetical protein K443DRAFT_8853 [Laccaria amethystina LaAM-08-1]